MFSKPTVMALSELVEKELEVTHQNKLSSSSTSLASVASLSMPLVQEIVLSADIRCKDCQERVADIMSRMIETYSVLVSVLEKKVTLTCRPTGDGDGGDPRVSKLYGGRRFCKIAAIKRMMFRSSRKQLSFSS